MLAMDLHVPQIQGFFGIPVDEVSAVPLFSRYFLSKGIKNPVVVAPDAGSAKRARSLAKRLDCPIAIIDKRRGAHNEADVMNIVGDVVGKNAILIDDIIDTGNSVVKAVESLSRLASEVYICATHGVFSDNCIDKLQSCQAKEIVISNTIPVERIYEYQKFHKGIIYRMAYALDNKDIIPPYIVRDLGVYLPILKTLEHPICQAYACMKRNLLSQFLV